MMVKVVQGGTGTNAQIPGVTVAGKTGTAETGRRTSTTRGSSSSRRPSTRSVAGAVVVESQLNGFGGAIAAPIAKQLMQAILPATSNGT